MSVDIIVPSSEPRYVSFQQIRTLASPFPPVGSVAARFRSPAVPHLRRYYRVVRLLPAPVRASSGRPLVARNSRPIARGGPPGVRVDEELSSVPGPSLWSMPWARDPGESARPRDIGRCQILPSASATTSASQRYRISGLILTACYLVVYASHPPVTR